MGSDSGKAHETYTVAPAGAGDEPVELHADPAGDAGTGAQAGKLEHTLELIAGLPHHTDEGKFGEDLAWLVGTAHAEIDELDVDEAGKQQWRAAVAAAAADALASLPDEQLQQLAAAAGFAHPTLVSGAANDVGGHGALVHWLNPAYPADAPSKGKIQAKAHERYQQLAAGTLEIIGGQTLAQVQASDQQLAAATPPPHQAWSATPAEVAAAMTGLHQALVELHQPGTGAGVTPDGDGGLQALLDAERTLVTADCPELGPDVDTARAAAAGLVSKQLDALPPSVRNHMIAQAVTHAAGDGTVTAAEAAWLDRSKQLALLRASSDPQTRQQMQQLAADRADQVAGLQAAVAAAAAAGPAPQAADPGAITSWAQAHAAALGARLEVAGWADQAADRAQLKTLGATSPWQVKHAAAAHTKAWRAWAKTQKLASLRAAAQAAGMDPADAAGATRAQLQNYLAAGWDPSLSQPDIHHAAANKAKPGSAPSPGSPGAPAAPAGSSPPSPSPPPAPSATSWAARHAAAAAVLKAHQAVAADVPTPRPAGEIAAVKLSKGAAAQVGGMHAKTLHTDPDGGTWLHKPDKTGGARAHAEAAAAALHNLAGVRTPPVYVRAAGGKPGALQPWVAASQPLPTDPGQWSQADVDQLVRFHVAAWACSNHDGNASNILRTPSGGLTPIDHGQAFRYFGDDRLALGYDPNSHYGNPPPAYLAAYKAAKTGGLAKDVRVRPEAALGVVKAFERIPDAQYRAALAPVATEGVKAGVTWVPRMRKAAQKRHGKTAVSDAEVAEEFLTRAVERKHSLRAAFADFFAGLGLDSKALTKVA